MSMALSSRGAFGSSTETGGSNSLGSAWVSASSEPFGVSSSKSSTQQNRPPSVAGRFNNFSDDARVGASLLNDDTIYNNGAFPYRTGNSGQFDAVKSSSNAQQRATLANAALMDSVASSSLAQAQSSATNSALPSFASANSAFGSYATPSAFGTSGSSLGGQSAGLNSRLAVMSSATNGGTPPPTLGANMHAQANHLAQLAALSNSARSSSSASQQNGILSSTNALFGSAAQRSAQNGASTSSTWMSLTASGSSSAGGAQLSQSQSQAQSAASNSQSNASANALRAAFQQPVMTPTGSGSMQMLFNQIMLLNPVQNQSDATSTTATSKDAPPALLDPSAFPILGRNTPPLLNGPSPSANLAVQQSGNVSLPQSAFSGNNSVGSTRTYVSAVGGRSATGEAHSAAHEFSIQPDDFPALPVTVSRPINPNAGNNGASSSTQTGVEQLNAAFSSMQLGGNASQIAANNIFPSTNSFSGSMHEPVRSASSLGGVVSGNQAINSDRFTSASNAAMLSAAGAMRTGAASARAPAGGQNTDGSIQLPTSIIPDHFGMLGVLSFLKAAEQDQEAVQLASGIDLTSLGVNVTASDQLYTSFASPWTDAPAKPHDIDCTVPAEYITSPFMRDKFPTPNMSRYNDDQLFFIFYLMVGDVQQLFAATELYNRDWRFHKEERVWITRIPNMEPTQKTNTYERGTYFYFDVAKWSRVHKEMVIEYDKLEEKQQLTHGASQYTMITAAAKMASAAHAHKLMPNAGGALSQSHAAQSSLGSAPNLHVPSSSMVSQHFVVGNAQSAAGASQSQQSAAAQFGNAALGMNPLAIAAMKQPHSTVGGNVNLPGALANAANGMFSVPSLN